MGFLDNTGLARVWSKITTALGGKVDKTTTVNGHALSGNVSVTKGDVGLGNVNNTSDANKPISTATQTALNGKVSTSTTVNGHALSSNVSITQQDIGIYSSTAPSNPSDGDIWLQPGSESNILHDTDIASSAVTGKSTVNAALTQLNSDVSNLNDHIGNLDYSNAGAHNAIYRGKCLGTSAAGTSPVTQEQWNQIKAGTFEDMYIGDYWLVGNNQYTICHFDYYYRNSDSDITAHHIVLMPRETIKDLDYTVGTSSRGSDNPSGGFACWNLTDSTAGGYIDSHIRTVVMPACNNRVKVDFGSNHILTISELYPNSFASSTDGRAAGWTWTSTDYACDLPNETMIYGSQVWGLGSNNTSPYFEIGIDKYQLAIMGLDESFVHNRGFAWWLRSVRSASYVAAVDDAGLAGAYAAAYSRGVRPRFCIYST